MPNLAQAAIKRATLAAQKQIESLDAASATELIKLYQQAADDIAQRIAAIAGSDGNVTLWQLQDLLTQVNAHLDALHKLRNTLINNSLATAAELGNAPFVSVLTTQNTSQAALDFVRNFVGADGLQLSDRIWRLDRQARDLVVNAIEQAVIQGHGAAQAARELLSRGESVPADISGKMSDGNAQDIGKTVNKLMTGEGSPMTNAMRLMRTEINRAQGIAYASGALDHPDAAGIRYKLSPAHPKPDICNLLSTQNLYGLGQGVYPDVASSGWPAHPNILSFLEIVFKDEVTAADKAGKETSLEALARLTTAQRIGVLGVNKAQEFDKGTLTKGMIRAKWSAVKKRNAEKS